MGTAIEDFETNIHASDHYVTMYVELRRLKGLGTRGRLDADNIYLLWLIRASVVSSMSALDSYVHDRLSHGIRARLSGTTPICDALTELVARVAPMKKGDDVRRTLRFIRSTTGSLDLAEAVDREILQYEAFQSPEKIDYAFRILGVEDVFTEVAQQWPGPNTTAAHIRRRLARYYKRRNQIAHESDLEESRRPRPITPDYVIACKKYVETLVTKLDALG